MALVVVVLSAVTRHFLLFTFHGEYHDSRLLFCRVHVDHGAWLLLWSCMVVIGARLLRCMVIKRIAAIVAHDCSSVAAVLVSPHLSGVLA
jgi:hypothetical protein